MLKNEAKMKINGCAVVAAVHPIPRRVKKSENRKDLRISIKLFSVRSVGFSFYLSSAHWQSSVREASGVKQRLSSFSSHRCFKSRQLIRLSNGHCERRAEYLLAAICSHLMSEQKFITAPKHPIRILIAFAFEYICSRFTKERLTWEQQWTNKSGNYSNCPIACPPYLMCCLL